MRNPAIIAALVLTLPWCGTAHAQWTESGFPAFDYVLSRGVFDVKVAAAGNGDLFISEISCGNVFGCSVTRVQASGALPWGARGVYVAEGIGILSPFQEVIVPDEAGGCWHVRSGFVQHISADGVLTPPWGTGGAWSFPVPYLGAPVTACRDGADGLFIAWVSGDGLHIGRRLRDGLPDSEWGTAGRIFALQSVRSFLSMIPDGAGGVVVFWTDDLPRALRLRPDGSPASGWNPAGLVLAASTPDYGGDWWDLPRLFPSGADACIAAWADHTTAARVVAQRFRLDGTLDPAWPAGGREVVAPDPALTRATVMGDGEGGIHALWTTSGMPRWTHLLATGAFAPDHGSAGIAPIPATARYFEYTLQGPRVMVGVPLAGGGLGFAWNDSNPPAPSVRVRWMAPDGSLIAGEPDSGHVIPASGYSPMLFAAQPWQGYAGHFLWQTLREPPYANVWQLWINRMYAGQPTPVQVALVAADAEPGCAHLRWQAAGGEGMEATVYRREVSGPWTARARLRADGAGALRYDDREVAGGERYGYELGVMEGGLERYVGEAWVTVPLGPVFALEGLRPNPSGGEPTVVFTLASAAPATLELLDVSGRRLLSRDLGTLGLGSHRVRLAEAQSFRSGVYWLRLTQGTKVRTARGVITR